MSERPSTPPAKEPGSIPKGPLTPEQVRRLEEKRLKAKAVQRERDAEQQRASRGASNAPSNGIVAGQKRPHSTIVGSRKNQPTSQRDASNTQKAGISKAPDTGVRPAKKFQQFVEYDFSKMTDTKGGFISTLDDPHNKAMKAPEPDEQKPANMSMAEWERQQLLKKLRKAKAGPYEPGINSLEKEKSKKCKECESLEIDFIWDDTFKTQVCNACKDKFPEKYSLLTKSEAREDYLLTNPELEDTDLLAHIEKPNPHKSHWHNMQLFLRYQVEEYAFSAKKWGTPEALDAEFERRQTVKKERKEKKFNTKLQELKKRTMVEAHKRRLRGEAEGEDAQFGSTIRGSNDRHEHVWGRAVENQETGMSQKTCLECGMEVEELEF